MHHGVIRDLGGGKHCTGVKCNRHGLDIPFSCVLVTSLPCVQTTVFRVNSGKFHLVRRSFEAYKSPLARPTCAGKSLYLSASIHLSTLIYCILQNLHWLPIEWRVHVKLATLAYKALHTGQPPYLSELLQHYEPTRTLRSSFSFQLSVPQP